MRQFLFQSQLAVQFLRGNESHCGNNDPEKTQHHNGAKPPGLPELRLHRYFQDAAGVVPHAIFVAGDDMKPVMPRRHLAVIGNPCVAGIGPGVVAAFQTIFESHLLGSGEIQTGVVDFKAVMPGRNNDGLPPRRTHVIVFLFPTIHQHGFNHNHRRLQVGFKLFGVDRRRAFGGGEPQSAVVCEACSRLGAARTFARRQSVAFP